ncbi:hypothetical protein [Simplicispira suum]|uniref:Uncharacterized protein n=1 Tax=Simplicispira suum TaxID=2109915 RepID=A0A2S0MX11_9BURK|nr:hypothetical protein [Simplicispira suum]AVO40436.1 hypothetical protein C6571_03310 [Simplicispira suum]
MDYLLQGMFGERSLTKVAGIFLLRAQAESALEQLRNRAGLDGSQVRLLRPEDADTSHGELFGRAVEPESEGVARTLVQTHVVGGFAGAVLGVALFLWLSRADNPLVASSPVVAFVAIVGFGITFGLLAAGLLALRPDHILLISRLRTALRENRWAVVVHPVNRAQTAKAKQVLEEVQAEVVSTA